MTITLLYLPIVAIFLPIFTDLAETVIVTYDFNITWVLANPDGAFVRPTIGINNQWPLPIMRVTKGDTVVVNVENGLGNQTTTLHFHGLYMNGLTHMDGPYHVTQCGIAPRHKFKYRRGRSRPTLPRSRRVVPIWRFDISMGPLLFLRAFIIPEPFAVSN
jgi:iron transport multicopper oxidase